MRLTDAGARTVHRLAAGLDRDRTPLVTRLVERGLAHPVVEPIEAPPLTVIIPCKDATIDRLLDALVDHEVIVVDDGSTPPLRFEQRDGLTVLRNDTARGPAAARNQALALVTTELVVMIDADVTVPAGWDRQLAAHFADPAVVLVAPRVCSEPGHDVRSRYESTDGPLDLGDEPASIRPRTRVSYVPAAMLMARAATLQAAGGFDDALRYGEDVDLVWRLAADGHVLRYEPAVVARHQVRPSWRAWFEQRRSYGSSAAPLATRHGDAVAPVVVSGWSALAWLMLVAGHPVVAVTVAGGTSAALARKLSHLPDANRLAIELAGRGHLGAGRVLAAGITRAWWPIVALAATRSRTARRALAASALVPSLVRWWQGDRSIDPVRYCALRLADDLAYSVGVWQGCWHEHDVRALLPSST